MNQNRNGWECSTVWSFPKRGDWATHKGDYRGNWAPQIPRNIILRYSEEGDTVLDQMVGGGTTLIECKLLGRNGIGIDINPDAIMITRDRLRVESIDENFPKTEQKTYVGDARNLNLIEDESILNFDAFYIYGA
ncbi:MAG: site-specific DNA-methyltransferase [Candidatus Altiarchaeota archaeon]|nr:site-specific DNA-methyltransferase [Candidatus Altiarchaeota archaeon]